MRVQFSQPSADDVAWFLVAWVCRLACLAVVIAFWIVLKNLLALYMAPWVSAVCATVIQVLLTGIFVVRAYEHMEDGLVLLVFLGILCVVNSGVRQAHNRAHHHAPTPHATRGTP